MPLLKDIIGETFVPQPNDEKRFVKKHVVTLFKNVYSDKEYDKLFKGTNIKAIDRATPENHGYNPGPKGDEKVYESFELHESSMPHLGHLMDFANRHSKKNDHVLGHVAHAAAMTAKDHGLWVHDVSDAFDKRNVYDKPTGKFQFGNKKMRSMSHSAAQKTIKNTFAKHLEKAKKNNTTFNHHKFETVLQGIPFGKIKESMVKESCHEADVHWDAIRHTAKKHAVSPSLVASSLLSYYTKFHSRGNDKYHDKPYEPETFGHYGDNGAVTEFRRTYHDYIEDKQRGLHEGAEKKKNNE